MDARIKKGWVSKKYGVKTAAPALTMVQVGSQPLFVCSLVARRVADGGPEVSSLRLMRSPSDNLLLFRADVSQNAQQIEVEQRPYFTIDRAKNVEWSSRVQN